MARLAGKLEFRPREVIWYFEDVSLTPLKCAGKRPKEKLARPSWLLIRNMQFLE